MKQFSIQAWEELLEELGREPLDFEVEERAQELYENYAIDCYERLKDTYYYGD